MDLKRYMEHGNQIGQPISLETIKVGFARQFTASNMEFVVLFPVLMTALFASCRTMYWVLFNSSQAGLRAIAYILSLPNMALSF